ncbi:hydrogenase expression/formation protein [Sessilibacter sp. MAH4]
MKGDIPLVDLSNPQSEAESLGINVGGGIIGPGSRVEEQVLNYLTMPKEMDSFDMPVLPEPEEMSDHPAVLAVLENLQKALDLKSQLKLLDESSYISLEELNSKELSLLYQTLGDGEVAAMLAADKDHEKIRIQETILAGVWWLQKVNASNEIVCQWLEVGAIPSDVQIRAEKDLGDLNFNSDELPKDTLNAGPVIFELLDKAGEHQQNPRSQPHVVNLSLLPFSPEDHLFLYERLGHGKVSILSRGYGNCRITSTLVAGVWRVQYFNSTDQLILDTLEVIGVPQVACAAIEDIEDSAERLREIHEALI